MDVLPKISGFVFIFLAVITLSTRAQDICVSKGPCSCEFSNGTGIDLTQSANSTFYTTQYFDIKNKGAEYDLVTFYYHPCFDVPFVVNGTTNSTCAAPLSLCRFQNTFQSVSANSTFKLDDGSYDFMGTSGLANFSGDGRSVVYYNGPSYTQILLSCSQTDDSLHMFDNSDPHRLVLNFFSRNACLKQIEEPGRSVGSTLCIIFFSFVIFYLVLGICTKKFLMGATGVEVIPNLGFWSDLPNLVKDGWAFTISGFKLPVRGGGPTTSPDPNSYDSI